MILLYSYASYSYHWVSAAGAHPAASQAVLGCWLGQVGGGCKLCLPAPSSQIRADCKARRGGT